MAELSIFREELMEDKECGITELYNEFFHEPASRLHKLHAKLDELVMQAYGFSADADILAELLALNQTLAAKEKAGEYVVGPWAPEASPATTQHPNKKTPSINTQSKKRSSHNQKTTVPKSA